MTTDLDSCPTVLCLPLGGLQSRPNRTAQLHRAIQDAIQGAMKAAIGRAIQRKGSPDRPTDPEGA
eukprot:12296987-Alexandrium_andersonii.AAC.1